MCRVNVIGGYARFRFTHSDGTPLVIEGGLVGVGGWVSEVGHSFAIMVLFV